MNIRKDGKFRTQEKVKLVCTGKSGSIKSAIDNLVQIWNHPCQGVDMRRHLHDASWQDFFNLNGARILSTSTLLYILQKKIWMEILKTV